MDRSKLTEQSVSTFQDRPLTNKYFPLDFEDDFETSVTGDSSLQNYPLLDDHTILVTDTLMD